MRHTYGLCRPDQPLWSHLTSPACSLAVHSRDSGSRHHAASSHLSCGAIHIPILVTPVTSGRLVTGLVPACNPSMAQGDFMHSRCASCRPRQMFHVVPFGHQRAGPGPESTWHNGICRVYSRPKNGVASDLLATRELVHVAEALGGGHAGVGDALQEGLLRALQHQVCAAPSAPRSGPRQLCTSLKFSAGILRHQCMSCTRLSVVCMSFYEHWDKIWQ